MEQTEFFLASSLEKVFPTRRPQALVHPQLTVWPGTRAAVQLVYFAPSGEAGEPTRSYTVTVSGAPCEVELFRVELVPSDFPVWEEAFADDNYLTREPGLFPDLLRPMMEAVLRPLPRQYRSLWLSFPLPEDAAAGGYPLTVTLADADGKAVCTLPLVLRVGQQLLPQSLIHTEWFHGDCLASYYHVAPLSEGHWQIMARFIQAAGRRHGINMLLTPVFTPPLDTAVGAERPTMQLVKVFCQNGAYSFDFTDLARWTALCHASGIEYLEIAHLFTQWGAKATPKILAEVDGETKRIFGWDVPAASPAYRAFLAALLPALRDELEHLGYDRAHVYFHISDEPAEKYLPDYKAARSQVEDLLEGSPIVDALSSYAFYSQGAVTRPIPSNDHIQAFADHHVPDLWTYYCCCQGYRVPNRFFAMPSARNRVMGLLMYLYQIKGFLQWGYNFYYTQFSRSLVDPFTMTHAGYAFPSGDAFLVYPGEGGAPLTSLRAEVQSEGLTDLRALQTLEQAAGREAVLRLVHQVTQMERITFTDYPKEAETLERLREAVFDALSE